MRASSEVSAPSLIDLTSAAGPWVAVMLEEIDARLEQGASSFFLKYAGITVASTPTGRILDDLGGIGWCHFTNFARVAAHFRRERNLQPAVWAVYQYRHRHPCSVLGLRLRWDLQTTERIVISSLLGLCLNSAPGGFHHIPHIPDLVPAAVSTLMTSETDIIPAALAALIRVHFEDSRQLWESVPGSGPHISDAAFAAVISQAQELRSVNGRVLSIMLGKDIPHEALTRAEDGEFGFYGSLVGPGPALSLRLRKMAMVVDEVAETKWCALVGGFLDFWCIVIVHRHVWIAIILLVRYLRLTRPLLLRVQSGKVRAPIEVADLQVANIIVTGSLHNIFEHANPDATLDAFMACGLPSDLATLTACVAPGFLGKIWRELFPPGWINWIGRVIVCQIGPDAEQDWTIIVIMVCTV